MKILAYVGNAIFLVLIAIEFIGKPEKWYGDILPALLLLAFPAVNIIALTQIKKPKNFISLYFERKRLEQEKLIKHLRKDMHEER